MGLRIDLKAGERIVINGAVLRNQTGSRCSLVIENQATLLREKDYMRPGEDYSPARRLYYLCMMAYLDETGRERYRDEFINWLQEFVGALRNPAAISNATTAGELVALGKYHKALTAIRPLIQYEDAVLQGAYETTRLQRAASDVSSEMRSASAN